MCGVTCKEEALATHWKKCVARAFMCAQISHHRAFQQINHLSDGSTSSIDSSTENDLISAGIPAILHHKYIFTWYMRDY